MGIFDFITNEFIEVIEWIDHSNDTLMWKFQDKGNDIKNGAKLTVRESQVAVLMNEGEFGDTYYPGLHTLSTNNMPITTTLKSWKYLFNSPFKVDIYFVNTRQFTNLKWGTSSPIIMRDAELGQVRLRSFGNFAIKIIDPKKLITEFAGTNPYVKISQVEETLKNIIASKMAEGFAEAKITVLDLSMHFSELGDALLHVFRQEFATYGISLEKFFIESVSLPEEVERILDKKTQMNVLKGSLDDFNKMQAGIALENISENDNAGNTMGMGAGVLMTNFMNQSAQNTENTASKSKTELMDILKQLGELKSQGILTEEEFTLKKQEILKQL
ncbi:SPFH domain-containing protein [uncultured Chryseobacterium sp.]|uniref:SPFH domain-containing protein n=1 Tax=uncultured Chryseobacterium sp. TaxID=259322 RepID=UPI0025D843DC|nr:SPFH domain-containing protein [uncultured Chryseobacterium sp.]